MDIREIEKIIDEHHLSSDFMKCYKDNRAQALYDVLRVFDGMALCAIIGSSSNPLAGVAEMNIQSLQDGLNEAVKWIYYDCKPFSTELLQSMSEQQHENAGSFLQSYAVPYSKICDGFIPYSR